VLHLMMYHIISLVVIFLQYTFLRCIYHQYISKSLQYMYMWNMSLMMSQTCTFLNLIRNQPPQLPMVVVMGVRGEMLLN